MPRGNDTDHVKELAQSFGSFQNAEELIAMHRARRNPRLRKANLVAVDKDATEKARKDLSKIDSTVGENLTAIDAAVRGSDTVVVVQDRLGRLGKVVLENGKLADSSEDPVERDLAAADTTAPVTEGVKDGTVGEREESKAEKPSAKR